MLKLKSPILQRLYDDWQARRGGRALPSRADFDPLDLKYVLGHLSLLDVFYDPVRFRYRVHGTQIAARFGIDLTWRYVDEATSADHRRTALDQYAAVVLHREPVLEYRDHQFMDARIWNCEVLVLPLSNDGQAVHHLLSGIDW